MGNERLISLHSRFHRGILRSVMGIAFAVMFLFVLQESCLAGNQVTAAKSSRRAGKVYSGKTYTVNVKQKIGGMVFTAPYSGFYTFEVSGLKKKHTNVKNDYSYMAFYLQNANDLKMTKANNQTVYLHIFDLVFCNGVMHTSKEIIHLGTKRFCRRRNAPLEKWKAYTSCKGIVYLNQGSYIVVSDFSRLAVNTDPVGKGWKYKLSIKQGY